MYLDYYSLDRHPFRITPDPALFYNGGENGRGVILEALLYAVQSGEGILKVVGEVGSGKTMLCRMLEERLPASVTVVYLANPKLTPHEILYAVAFELNLPVTQETPRLVLMQKLQEYLLEQHGANRTVLVIIEEAQSMPLETLEEIRLFSNLETHQHKLMQIILFGQPELDKNLQNKNIRQLRERITHSFYLDPLKPDEVSEYIKHRLQAAGCPVPQVFSKKAEKLIARASGGLTRRINILADKSMLAAYGDSATTNRPRSLRNQLQTAVKVSHVKAAIKDSDYRESAPRRFWRTALVTAVIALSVVASWQAYLLYEMQQAAEVTAVSEPVAATVAEPSVDLALVTAATAAEPQAAVQSEAVADIEPLAQSEAVAELEAPSEAVTALAATASDETTSLPEPDPWPAIVAERREAFIDWFYGEDRGSFALQILSVGEHETDYLSDALRTMQRAGLIDLTFTCLVPGAGGPMWRVIYGSFDTVDAARSNISTLPSAFTVNVPFVQNVNRLECL